MGGCRSLLNRIPYATLVAFIICVLGLIIFSIGSHRHNVIGSIMINDVLKEDDNKLNTIDLSLIFVEIPTGILAMMILITGILATGDTREQVFSVWKVRLGGRICCLVLMTLTTVFLLIWFGAFWASSMWMFALFVSDNQCDLYYDLNEDNKCLNLSVIYVLLEKKTNVQICDVSLVKKFCKDYVEKGTAAWVIAGVGNFFVLVGLVMFLICLSSNYAKIRCQAKYEEVSELRRLEGDLHSSKERF